MGRRARRGAWLRGGPVDLGVGLWARSIGLNAYENGTWGWEIDLIDLVGEVVCGLARSGGSSHNSSVFRAQPMWASAMIGVEQSDASRGLQNEPIDLLPYPSQVGMLLLCSSVER